MEMRGGREGGSKERRERGGNGRKEREMRGRKGGREEGMGERKERRERGGEKKRKITPAHNRRGCCTWKEPRLCNNRKLKYSVNLCPGMCLEETKQSTEIGGLQSSPPDHCI